MLYGARVEECPKETLQRLLLTWNVPQDLEEYFQSPPEESQGILFSLDYDEVDLHMPGQL